MIYDKLKYDGRKHLTDDVLHQYYELLRKKIGSQGALIVAIDACHSGESYRGDDEQEFFNLIDDEIVDECIIDSALTEINEYDSYERGTALGFSKNKKEYIVKKNSAKNGGLYYSGIWQELVVYESEGLSDWARKILVELLGIYSFVNGTFCQIIPVCTRRSR